MPQLFGPFKQIITLQGLPLKGALNDDQLIIIDEGGILMEDGLILRVGPFRDFDRSDYHYIPVEGEQILLPSMVDCHTHLIWGGSRSRDYSMRMAGQSYQDILAAGGGIFDSVAKTREASEYELLYGLKSRAERHLRDGVTTIEVKTGYGLLPAEELRLLQLIRRGMADLKADLVPTCLAAHVCPKEFETVDFLNHLQNELLPEVLVKGLTRRIDIFVEDHAFPERIAKDYLTAAKKLGFDLTVHADQFSTGGSRLAVQLGARSADHLEASGSSEIEMLAASEVIPVALPGASLGLGMNFAPARKLLDKGASLAIATDWNPGSAPMGDLLVQASLLGIYEKLSTAELLAGVTFRAASALGLHDRGIIEQGKKADLMSFPLSDVREIFYHQGKLKPSSVWKNGELL